MASVARRNHKQELEEVAIDSGIPREVMRLTGINPDMLQSFRPGIFTKILTEIFIDLLEDLLPA
jgi:hypothetical protein